MWVGSTIKGVCPGSPEPDSKGTDDFSPAIAGAACPREGAYNRMEDAWK